MALKIPGAGTKTSKEWLNSEHALASGLVHERRWTEDGPLVREANKLVWLDRSKVQRARRPTFRANSSLGPAGKS